MYACIYACVSVFEGFFFYFPYYPYANSHISWVIRSQVISSLSISVNYSGCESHIHRSHAYSKTVCNIN